MKWLRRRPSTQPGFQYFSFEGSRKLGFLGFRLGPSFHNSSSQKPTSLEPEACGLRGEGA